MRNKSQQIIEILKYFSQNLKLKIPLEKFNNSDSFKDIYRKFQINANVNSVEYENATKLYKIMIRILNSLPADDALSPQVEKEWEELMSKKPLSRRKDKLDSLEFGQKYSLVQKGAEGNFFFTSAVARHFNDLNVDTSTAKIKIEPARSIQKDKIPKLGIVAGSSVVKSAVRKIRKGFKLYSAEFPEYGSFFSFAPSVDLGRANLSRIDSIAVRYPGRKVFIEKGLPIPQFPVKIYNGEMDTALPQMISLPTDEELDNLKDGENLSLDELDLGFLKQLGVDLDHLLENKEKDMDIDVDDSTLFAQNVELIKKLVDYQEERFRKGSENVSSEELEVAASVKANLARIVSSFAPKDVVTVDQVRKGMKYVKKTEKAFRGGLSQQAPFVFPCNTAGNGVIPPGSGTVPLALLKEVRKTD